MAPQYRHSTLSLPVVLPSLLLIGALLLVCAVAPTEAGRSFGGGQKWITRHFSWFYVLAVGMFLILLLWLAFSEYGRIRLGPDDARPEFSFASWLAMLFAAGMGIGLMYLGVGEPMMHFLSPPEAAREAMVTTFFDWGFHAWAIYATVGLVLARRTACWLSRRSACPDSGRHPVRWYWADVSLGRQRLHRCSSVPENLRIAPVESPAASRT